MHYNFVITFHIYCYYMLINMFQFLNILYKYRIYISGIFSFCFVNRKQQCIMETELHTGNRDDNQLSMSDLADYNYVIHPPISCSQSLKQAENTREDFNNNLRFSIKSTFSSVNKDIKIKVEKVEESRETAAVKQCRICLEGQEEGRMVRPCQCSGTITYAHEKCLIEWIKRKHDARSKNKLACQMCQTTFTYRFGKLRSLDYDSFCMNYQKERCNFIIFYLFMAFLFIVTAGLIYIISESSAETEMGIKIKSTLMKTENVKIIYICVVFILIIVFMFLLVLFIVEYAVKTEITITEVMNYCQVNLKKKIKIYPKFMFQSDGTSNNYSRQT